MHWPWQKPTPPTPLPVPAVTEDGRNPGESQEPAARPSQAPQAQEITKAHETHKLSYEQQRDLCKRLAAFEHPSDIMKVMQLQGVSISSQLLSYYRHAPTWSAVIRRDRELFLKDFSEAPLAHKRLRLERLESLYQSSTDRKELLTILEAARRECQDPQGREINILNITSFSNIPTEELAKKRTEVLQRLQATTVEATATTEEAP